MTDLTLDVRAEMITKAVEDGWAEFEGIASSPDLDLTGDVLASGCFDPVDTSTVAMLWAHNGAEPVGKWLHIGTVAGRLIARGALRLTLAKGREAYDAIRHKIAPGLSVGFRTEAGDSRYDNRGRRTIKKARLLEISIVTVPANSAARITEVRSFQPVDIAERVARLDQDWAASISTASARIADLQVRLGDVIAASAARGEIPQAEAATLLRELISGMRQ